MNSDESLQLQENSMPEFENGTYGRSKEAE